MRGVILAGGMGTRLRPCTLATNKHILPVYNKPMIYYPIETLVKCGIKDIAIVVSGKNPGDMMEIIKDGKSFGLNSVTYLFQEKPDGGVLDALASAKAFCQSDNFLVILGDNVTDFNPQKIVKNFKSGAHIFLKKVEDPENFGVVRFDLNKHFVSDYSKSKILEIIEKPQNPPSNFAVTGLYLFDHNIFSFIENCKPSSRGQLEIVDGLNQYLMIGALKHSFISGFWHDCGTYDNLFKASTYWHNKSLYKKLASSNNLLTNESIDFFLKWRNIPISRVGNYSNRKTPITWKCTIDNSTWDANPSNIMINGHERILCRTCLARNRTDANNIHLDNIISPKIKRVSDCVKMSGKCKFLCLNCHQEWKTNAVDVALGHGCPKCKNKIEKNLLLFLEENFSKKFFINYQFCLPEKPSFYKRRPRVDFFLKEKIGEKQFVIEYNGPQHYKPMKFSVKSSDKQIEDQFLKQKLRDDWVREFCQKHSIEILEFSYQDTLDAIKKTISKKIT